MDVLNKVPVREQEPAVRATNFEEVCLGYNEEEAVAEAGRCLNCKNAQCMKGCPVSINIPAFIQEVKNRNFEKAYEIISESSALPAVCGRVCPQESQCEGKCIRGIKGEAVSIGKLERFVADWARENGIRPKKAEKMNGCLLYTSIKKVGILYDKSQDSSKTPVEDAIAYCTDKGVEVIEKTGTTNDEISLAADALVAAGVDAVFTPTDNTVMTAELAIYEKFTDAKIPHYAGADSFALNLSLIHISLLAFFIHDK